MYTCLHRCLVRIKCIVYYFCEHIPYQFKKGFVLVYLRYEKMRKAQLRYFEKRDFREIKSTKMQVTTIYIEMNSNSVHNISTRSETEIDTRHDNHDHDRAVWLSCSKNRHGFLFNFSCLINMQIEICLHGSFLCFRSPLK